MSNNILLTPNNILIHKLYLFNSDKQAKRVRHDFSVTENAWNARRQIIRSKHRAEAARTDLAQSWKQRLISKGGGAAAPAVGAAVAVADEAQTLTQGPSRFQKVVCVVFAAKPLRRASTIHEL